MKGIPYNFVFFAVGIIVCWSFRWLYGACEKRMPAESRTRLYRLARDLPGLVIYACFMAFVFTTVGATFVYYLIGPFVSTDALPDTSWAPEMLGGLLIMWYLGFWISPELTPELPLRGRPVSRPRFMGNRTNGRSISRYVDEDL